MQQLPIGLNGPGARCIFDGTHDHSLERSPVAICPSHLTATFCVTTCNTNAYEARLRNRSLKYARLVGGGYLFLTSFLTNYQRLGAEMSKQWSTEWSLEFTDRSPRMLHNLHSKKKPEIDWDSKTHHASQVSALANERLVQHQLFFTSITLLRHERAWRQP